MQALGEVLAYFMQSLHEIYRSTSLLIWSETNILEMCIYEVFYLMVQYGKWVHVVAKPAILLSEQFNWSHVIKNDQ